MPARAEEVKHAKQEGVEFRMLTNPEELLGDEKGWLTGARCVRMELGEPDAAAAAARWRSKARSSFCLPAGHHRRRHHGKSADPEHHAGAEDHQAQLHRGRPRRRTRTSKRGVFAGGDIVTGGATVILAMGAGRKAAASIHEYLTTGNWELPKKPAL